MLKHVVNIKMGLPIVCVSFFCNVHAKAFNDTISVHRLLAKLEQLQSAGNGYFAKGLFPSWRQYNKRKDVSKADENIFYTGLIVFTLRKYYPYFTKDDKTICDSIIARATSVFSKFMSLKKQHVYNFWRTNPPVVFPNGGWLNWFNKIESLPDDADDSVISLMALCTPDSVAVYIHHILAQHANLQKKRIKNTYKKYRNVPAYSTWLGKNMPVDFDVSVLCNVLYFVQHYQLKWTNQDSASLYLIMQVIKNKEYLTNAAYVSPHYHRTAVVMYHMSRLFSALDDSVMSRTMKDDFIQEVKNKFYSSKNIVDKIILNTSLMRLKQNALPLQIPPMNLIENDIEQSDFIFFIADMSSFLSNLYRIPISKTGLVKFNYYCPAYNDVLLIENLILQQQSIGN